MPFSLLFSVISILVSSSYCSWFFRLLEVEKNIHCQLFGYNFILDYIHWTKSHLHGLWCNEQQTEHLRTLLHRAFLWAGQRDAQQLLLWCQATAWGQSRLCQVVLDVFKSAGVPPDFKEYHLTELYTPRSDPLEDLVESIKQNGLCLKGILATPNHSSDGELKTLNMKLRWEISMCVCVLT